MCWAEELGLDPFGTESPLGALNRTQGAEVKFTLGKDCWGGSAETETGEEEISPGTSESRHWVEARG